MVFSLASLPDVKMSPDGYVIGPGTMVLLVVAVAFVLPFAKWAAAQLWAQREKSEEHAEQQGQGLVKVVQQLANEMRAGFQEIRELISSHNAQLTGLAVRVGHLEEAEKRVDVRQDRIEQAFTDLSIALRKELTESRTQIRNEISAELRAARKLSPQGS